LAIWGQTRLGDGKLQTIIRSRDVRFGSKAEKLTLSRCFPLCRDKQTSASDLSRSAKFQKATSAAHSITLSACNSSAVGTSTPIAFAVFRFTVVMKFGRPLDRKVGRFRARRDQSEICPDFDERRTASASCSHSAAISR
jgi:hypothetical protein